MRTRRRADSTEKGVALAHLVLWVLIVAGILGTTIASGNRCLSGDCTNVECASIAVLSVISAICIAMMRSAYTEYREFL